MRIGQASGQAARILGTLRSNLTHIHEYGCVPLRFDFLVMM